MICRGSYEAPIYRDDGVLLCQRCSFWIRSSDAAKYLSQRGGNTHAIIHSDPVTGGDHKPMERPPMGPATNASLPCRPHTPKSDP